MSKKIIRIILFLTCLIIVSGGIVQILRRTQPQTALAVGDLEIDWGVPDGDPIFVVTNMLPGDVESRTVEVTNNATSPRPVSVRSELIPPEIANLSAALDFVISEDGTDLYGGSSATGPKTLQEFLNGSTLPDSIFLSILTAGEVTHYTFKATFNPSSGDEFQNGEVVFNLIIGIDVPVPAECEGITFPGFPIFGTEGNDRIDGTLRNDLIFALEGNDRVSSFGGDDCIVGGEGNDQLRGDTGHDIIFGNEGNDLVVGAVGNDHLFGGEGNDTIRGENNDDVIEGGDGDDFITGGAGVDEINAGAGNDKVRGEAGHDHILGGDGNDELDGGAGDDEIDGEAGDDTLAGKANNDHLIGGPDTDSINGYSGFDTCDGEVELYCEI